MKKNFQITIVAGIVFFVLAGAVIFSISDEVIGVVLSVKGSFILERGTKTQPLAPGDRIYKDCIIKPDESAGTARGKVQIGSDSGPVVYTKFPVRFNDSTFSSLSADQQKNYISCVGGTVLTSRSVTLFDWFMNNLGALDEKDIKAGFTLMFSKTKNSGENLILDPLCFKLKDDVQIKSVQAKLIDKESDNKTVLDNLKIEKKGADWTIRFDQYKYTYASEYTIKGTAVLMNDKKEPFEFSFYVYGEEEMAYIEDEAAKNFGPAESAFGKSIIRAGKYREYELHLKGLRLLKDAGIDIDGML